MSNLIQQIYDGVIDGDIQSVQTSVETALDTDINPETILNEGMIAAMTEVGRLFEDGEYFVPEMLVAAKAMQAGLTLLRPALAKAEVKSRGRVAIGTVKGDLHDIGKNLASMMLEGAGYEIIDMGVDIPPDKFVEAFQNDTIDVVALSALLTTTVSNMEATIQAFESAGSAGVRDRIKIIIGGAPDASQAVKITNALMVF